MTGRAQVTGMPAALYWGLLALGVVTAMLLVANEAAGWVAI